MVLLKNKKKLYSSAKDKEESKERYVKESRKKQSQIFIVLGRS